MALYLLAFPLLIYWSLLLPLECIINHLSVHARHMLVSDVSGFQHSWNCVCLTKDCIIVCTTVRGILRTFMCSQISRRLTLFEGF